MESKLLEKYNAAHTRKRLVRVISLGSSSHAANWCARCCGQWSGSSKAVNSVYSSCNYRKWQWSPQRTDYMALIAIRARQETWNRTQYTSLSCVQLASWTQQRWVNRSNEASKGAWLGAYNVIECAQRITGHWERRHMRGLNHTTSCLGRHLSGATCSQLMCAVWSVEWKL